MTSPAGLPPPPLITDAMCTTVRGFTHVFRGSAESKRVICSFPCLFDGTYCSVPCGSFVNTCWCDCGLIIVLDEGVEPSHPFGHSHLKRARLPFRQSSMNLHLTLCSCGSSACISDSVSTCCAWYRRRESNPHTRRHQDLNLACLPFHHSGLLPVRENKGLLGFPPGLILFSPTGLMMTTLPPAED